MHLKKSVFFIISFFVLLLVSCQSSTELSKVFSCKNPKKLSQLEVVNDFKNNFSVKIPKYWNTQLYYNDIQSEIFSADTIKSLTDTYIMNFSMVNSNLKIDSELKKRVLEKAKNNHFEIVKELFYKFKEMETFSILSKGKSQGHTLQVLQTYINVSDEKYLLVKAEFYGENNFNARLCEAINLMDDITLINKN